MAYGGNHRHVLKCVITHIVRPNTPRRHAQNPILRALHASTSAVVHVGVDHRCLDVAVPEQFLDRANVVTRFQQMWKRNGVSNRLENQVG